jgi:hypothetical protein
MLICSECGKELKNKRALNGHLWLAHRKRTGWKWELEQEVASLKQLYNSLADRYNALISQNKELQLAQEHAESKSIQELKAKLEQAKKCPQCGYSWSIHHYYDDLLMGKGFKCP